MNRLVKLSVVLAGNAGALVLAVAVVYVQQLLNPPDPIEASGGMYAFGELARFLATFGFLSLIPTALGLYFLRSVERFWSPFSWASLALAVTGPIAILLYSTVVRSPLYTDWVLTGLFVIARIGASPLLALGFFVSAVIAPGRRARFALLGASAIEAAVSAGVFISLFVSHMR